MRSEDAARRPPDDVVRVADDPRHGKRIHHKQADGAKDYVFVSFVTGARVIVEYGTLREDRKVEERTTQGEREAIADKLNDLLDEVRKRDPVVFAQAVEVLRTPGLAPDEVAEEAEALFDMLQRSQDIGPYCLPPVQSVPPPDDAER